MIPLEFYLELFVVFIDLFVFCSSEERSPAKKHVEYSAKRKDVASWLNMFASLKADNFRCDISRCSAPKVEVFLLIAICTKAEVYNDRLKGISSKHDVLRLEISMHDSFLVHMCQSL